MALPTNKSNWTPELKAKLSALIDELTPKPPIPPWEQIEIPIYTPELQQWLEENVLSHPKYEMIKARPMFENNQLTCGAYNCTNPGRYWIPHASVTVCPEHIATHQIKRYKEAWWRLRTEIVYVKLKQANLIHNLD